VLSAHFPKAGKVTEALLKERIAALPVTPAGCRLWPGVSHQGYAAVSWQGQCCFVHRVLWQLERGPLTTQQRIINRCGHRACVNLDHWQLKEPLNAEKPPPMPRYCKNKHRMSRATAYLSRQQRGRGLVLAWRCALCRLEAGRRYRQRLERRWDCGFPVPETFALRKQREGQPRSAPPSLRAGRPVSDYCLHGHRRTEQNTRVDRHGHKRCLECAAAVHAREKAAVEEARRTGQPLTRAPRAACIHGHERTPANTYVTTEGWHRCRLCRQENYRAYRERKAEKIVLRSA